ncbi:undecaprenyl/decaprenyl-phosphate alpha-N-acetylglucosaminyl 1-phosphate transferase [Candidatus Babeliales bacterium]|nr:undecaprenyl/decaprenyl-phosphate alpha-N-acetylglucosaminyl 1-phosphate transferase [Candidatus Babeliales bacterium]
MFILRSISACILSFIVTFLLVPVMRSLAYTFGIIDVPDGKIKTHKQATPYLGGIAVYAGFLFALAATMSLSTDIIPLVVGCTVLLFVGLLDDIITITPLQKFLGQLGAAIILVKGGFYLKDEFFHTYWFLAIPCSLLWILTITNAINLVDIMDGLAVTIAGGATLSFLVIALFAQNSTAALMVASLLGALIAFYLFNKMPARIYLGDAGALFIGGVLASVPFLFNWSLIQKYGLVSPLVILGVPILEVCSLIAIRMKNNIPFYLGSPHHFAHYLQRKKWMNKVILFFVLGVSLLLGVIAGLFLYGYLSIWHMFWVLGGVLGFWLAIVY